MKSRSERRVSVLFYLLTAYILLQFAWWAYLLVDLNRLYYGPQGVETVNLKIWMVIGEGTVFLIFLLAGIYIMQRTIRKEIGLVRQQRNFLLSVTHELKTPLAAIKLGIQTLQKRKELKPEQRRPLEQSALSNTERLHALLDNVLLATRIESGQHPIQPAPTNLSALTEKIAVETASALGKSDFIKISVQPDLTASVDGNAYESILINLLENAFKYGDGSEVVVELKRMNGELILSVKDQGQGIPADERKRIFAKFYRMGNEETRSKKGTGIGLFIVKELTELHGGRVRAEANAPQGSVFRVTFPLA